MDAVEYKESDVAAKLLKSLDCKHLIVVDISGAFVAGIAVRGRASDTYSLPCLLESVPMCVVSLCCSIVVVQRAEI